MPGLKIVQNVSNIKIEAKLWISIKKEKKRYTLIDKNLSNISRTSGGIKLIFSIIIFKSS